MTSPALKHSALCDTAKKWLTRSNSQRGHGCHVALSECRSGWGGEMPDAIGYRSISTTIPRTETVVVEVKVSRADFLADAKKPHRADGEGMGLYRYYMCPEGLIKPEEVPPRWGLLWVNARGNVKPILGPVALSNNCGTFDAACLEWQHARNTEREIWLLVRVMARIDDPDKVKNTINAALREQKRLAETVATQDEKIRKLQAAQVTQSLGPEGTTELLVAIRRKTNTTSTTHQRQPKQLQNKEMAMPETKPIQPVEVVRDPSGYFCHPSFQWDHLTTYEDIRKWFADHQLEHVIVSMQDQLDADEYEARLEADNHDADGWNPKPPDDGPWFILSIHCADDGPCCVMAKPALSEAQRVA